MEWKPLRLRRIPEGNFNAGVFKHHRHVCRNFFPSWDSILRNSSLSHIFFFFLFFFVTFAMSIQRDEGNIEASSFFQSIFVNCICAIYFYIVNCYYSSPRANSVAQNSRNENAAAFLRFEKFSITWKRIWNILFIINYAVLRRESKSDIFGFDERRFLQTWCRIGSLILTMLMLSVLIFWRV